MLRRAWIPPQKLRELQNRNLKSLVNSTYSGEAASEELDAAGMTRRSNNRPGV